MASFDFRQLDNVTHGRVSVGTATFQSIVIYFILFYFRA